MKRTKIFSLVLAVSMLIGVTYGQNGHGTHVSGTIGAVGNNGIGVHGGHGRDVLVGGLGVGGATAPAGFSVQYTGLEMLVRLVPILIG